MPLRSRPRACLWRDQPSLPPIVRCSIDIRPDGDHAVSPRQQRCRTPAESAWSESTARCRPLASRVSAMVSFPMTCNNAIGTHRAVGRRSRCRSIITRNCRITGITREVIAGLGPHASRLVWLCRDDHLWVESHRLLAYGLGLLVRHGVTPCCEIPVFHHGRWVLLDDNGDVVQVEAEQPGLRARVMSRTAGSRALCSFWGRGSAGSATVLDCRSIARPG